ncbi:hypothetical protein QYQ75_27770 (plasmid) [Klebsiella pneumoniae]|nr:hypothetical protein [Klebsiella pneumoniae]WKI27684.1 hypothetical protein QYQ75_27770 [Klebsiella pneumoniae]
MRQNVITGLSLGAHGFAAHGSEMDTVSSGTAIRSSYSRDASINGQTCPLWLTYQEMMPTLISKRSACFLAMTPKSRPEKWQVVSSLERSSHN